MRQYPPYSSAVGEPLASPVSAKKEIRRGKSKNNTKSFSGGAHPAPAQARRRGLVQPFCSKWVHANA